MRLCFLGDSGDSETQAGDALGGAWGGENWWLEGLEWASSEGGEMSNKWNDVAECCKGLSEACRNWQCLHYDQHRGRTDASRDGIDSKKCTVWHWCNFIQGNVRCLKKNTIG